MYFLTLLACSLNVWMLSSSSEEPISKSTLYKHTAELSDDSYLGRGTLEPGLEKAADYLQQEYRKAGLRPIDGQQSMRMPYTLYQSGWDATQSQLRLQTSSAAQAMRQQQWQPFSFSGTGEVQGEIVFAGYGITAPEHQWDDYQGLDVKGKIVLVFRREPQADNPKGVFDGKKSTKHAWFTTKAKNAQAHGAKAMILVDDPLHPNPSIDFRWRPRLTVDKPKQNKRKDNGFLALRISQKTAQSLVGPNHSLKDIQLALDKGQPNSKLAPISARANIALHRHEQAEAILLDNVVGVLPGSDPQLQNEFVVVGAHFDHLGAFEGPGDTIYNGADDNASGTAALLTLAKAFSEMPVRNRKRSMIFAAFSAEELGLLGSRAFIRQIDPKQTTFMLNFDMIGRNAEQPVSIIGDGYAIDLQQTVQQANKDVQLPLEFSGDDYFGASDHHPFYQKGRPFLFFFAGIHPDYHQLGDHIDKLNFDRMEQITKLGFHLLSPMVQGQYQPQFIHHIPWLASKLIIRDQKALVHEVDTRGRGYKSGLRNGDILHNIESMIAADKAKKAGFQISSDTSQATTPDKLQAIELIKKLQTMPNRSKAVVSIQRAAKAQNLTFIRPPKASLGISLSELELERRKKHNLPRNRGILIRRVVKNGAAAKSGLQKDDILVEINGYSVNRRNLGRVLQLIGANSVVPCTVIRGEKTMNLKLTVGIRKRK